MEKQAIILFLLLSLLLASKGMNFADESIPVRQPLRDKLASAARHFLGLPYRWGGMSERSGMDCSGLVKALFAKLNIEMPRTSREQFHSGQDIAVENLRTGDLLAGFVIITDLNQPWYVKHFLGARRIVESEEG
ncbi:MAG: NlpC/P60 family protein [Deltaproteobacteria bacterium]|nr:MAG: NlpC/P60 family protein [Deltaproteobacteria bacterium]